MKLSSISSIIRPALLGTAFLCSAAMSEAAFVINEATGLFTPSFRGEDNTTYFGWSNGTIGVGTNTINGTPSINPDNLTGTSFLVQNGTGDVISGSNNVYGGVTGINNAQLVLNIPTDGTVGLGGFTTIIVQGYGQGFYDTFTFGAINGVAAQYFYGQTATPFDHSNPALETSTGLWWAKWELPGNQASYQVNILGHSNGIGVVSVTDLVVDTKFSQAGFAGDTAVVPEPTTAVLGTVALGLLSFRRNRRQR